MWSENNERSGFTLTNAANTHKALLESNIFKYAKIALTIGLQNDRIIMGFISEVIFLPTEKKMGRPTDNPKGTSIHVRLDEESKTTLNKYCEQEQVTKMEATRRGIKKLKDDLKE